MKLSHAAPRVERGEYKPPRGQKTHKASGRPCVLKEPDPQLVDVVLSHKAASAPRLRSSTARRRVWRCCRCALPCVPPLGAAGGGGGVGRRSRRRRPRSWRRSACSRAPLGASLRGTVRERERKKKRGKKLSRTSSQSARTVRFKKSGFLYEPFVSGSLRSGVWL